MTSRLRLKLAAGIVSLAALLPVVAFAHEAYVLDHNFFWSQLSRPYSLYALNALNNLHNFGLFLIIVGFVAMAFFLNFLWRRSPAGRRMSPALEKLAPYGPLFTRVTIALSFLFSAHTMSFLGPELPLASLPYAHFLQLGLYAASVLILLGFLTELAALLALVIFTLGFFHFGTYIFTYFNYLGEMLVLLLLGMRKWSLDGLIFGNKLRLQALKKYESTIVRVCYGLALIFAAITVKFLHPALTLEVINHWNLTQFYWLFPRDPLLVTLGAGLAECAIGLFIILGFELRFTVLISLFYITLSLLFFRELVWPHLLLYGISFNLLVSPEDFTLDKLIFNRNGPSRQAGN